MDAIFFTGFPGFLGSELLPRVLDRLPEAEAICLVQPRFAALARERATALAQEHRPLQGRVRIVEGDIAAPGLGLGAEPVADVVEIFHLAAVYDLSVARELGLRVNLEGTRNVLELARRCPRLRRFQYVSTCFVSGRYPGRFTEGMLEEGQSFNNFYEETKYLAEVEVQRAMREGLPATIYRPAIVVGDSATGATQKYDGPYFVIQWLLRQPERLAILPVVGDLTSEFNVVPRDFVVSAIAWLSGRAGTLGGVYQLADPHPLTVAALIEQLERATGRRIFKLPLPLGVAKWAIRCVPGVARTLRIPASAIDYFVHPTRYDTGNAQAALAGSGIRCPPFSGYGETLVGFARQHPEVGSAAMA
jgi:thioester reductase-like protein